MRGWLDFLEARLSHYDNYYNFSLSTLIVLFGVITGAISFSFNLWWSYLVALAIIITGIAILIRKGNVVLARISKKRNQTMDLIVRILDGSVSDPKDVAGEWVKIPST